MDICRYLACLCVYLNVLYLVLAELCIVLVALNETVVYLGLVLYVLDVYHKAGIVALCDHLCIFSC